MNEGISVEEACRTHSLSADDFVRQCTTAGGVKGQAESALLYIVAGVVLVVICIVLAWGMRSKKRPPQL